MSRRDDQRLADILAAAGAIAEHFERGDLDDALVFDAVRVRLIEMGEAVKAIDPGLLAREPAISCMTCQRWWPPSNASSAASTTMSRLRDEAFA